MDELKVYRGKNIEITSKLYIKHPSLDQIQDFGEKEYFNSVYTFCSVGADMKWQLWDAGIDYTQIEDYDLFVQFIAPALSSKKMIYNELISHQEKYEKELKSFSQEDLIKMTINPLELLFDFDFADFILMKEKIGEKEEIILYNPTTEFTFNRFSYRKTVDVIRQMHGIKRNNEIPANERTKMDMIEDSRDDYNIAKNKPFVSILKPLISTMSAYCGLCGTDFVWNMKIGSFFYDIKRIGIIEEATNLLRGGYSGFTNLKDVDKEKLNMFSN